MIQIENLKKSFGDYHTLKGLNLSVNKGEIYGFLGKNGAGKSTTMNIISGLSKLDSGTCIINNKDVTKIKHPKELQIGYLPENPNFQPWLTAYETLELLVVNHTMKNKREHIQNLLEWVGLKSDANRRVGGFSRGMKQRLGIACALINDPELLILDEPSSALDPEGRADVLSLIMDLKTKGKTVILSTHILSDVERVCDKIGLLNEGKIVIEKELNELLNNQLDTIIDVEYDGELSKSVIENFKNIEHVQDITISKTTIAIAIDSKQHIKQTMNMILENDLSIISMTLRKTTLEDLFIKEVNNK